MMVGGLSFAPGSPRATEMGPSLLEVANLLLATGGDVPALKDVSLSVRAGEILGVAGVSGNGQSELAAALSGIRAPDRGAIVVGGSHLAGAPPDRFIDAGVGRIPEDRHAAVVGDFSVAYNLALEHLDSFRRRGVLDEGRIRAHAKELIARFDIRARPDDPIRTLSGGNIQKVLLARVLSREPKVIVAAQPTRGLDVGATDFVRRQLTAQRDRGAAVLLISEDLDEILALSDRIVVMYEGEIAGEVDHREASPDRLGLLMAGMRESG